MSCSACHGTIADGEDILRCVIEKCKKHYHPSCTGMGNLSGQEVHSWVCPECSCNMKRGGDNSRTPVGHAKKSRDSRDSNVTIRKKVTPIIAEVLKSHEPNIDVPSEFQAEIRNLRTEMSSLRNQLTHAVSLISSYETKLDSYAIHVAALNTKLEMYENRHLKTPPRDYPPSVSADATASVTRLQETKRLIKPQQQRPLPITSSGDNTGKVAITVAVEAENGNKSARALKQIESNDVSGLTDQHWTEVRRRRSRGPISLCGAAGPAITSLKAVEPIRQLHLWNMASSADDIRQYLKQLCPTGSCTVEELTPKGNYKSYKLSVPEAHYDTCYSTDVWPTNARIKAWINYRKPASQARVDTVLPAVSATSPDQQPFRGPCRS